MCGDTQNPVRSQRPAGGARFQVLLAQVNAVRPGFQGDLHTVVNDADGPLPAAQGRKLLRLRQKGGLIQVLFPQLDDGRAAVDGVLDLAEEGVPVRRPGPVGDGVEP